MYEMSVCVSHKTQTLVHYVDQVVKVFEANIAGYYENIFFA